MAVKPETRIVDKIKVYLRTVWDGDCYHVHGSMMQRKGEPDLDGSLYTANRWVHFKLEVKTPDGTPTELQLHRLRVYYKRGYMTGIVTSVEDVQRLVMAYTEFLKEAVDLPFKKFAERFGIDDRWKIWD